MRVKSSIRRVSQLDPQAPSQGIDAAHNGASADVNADVVVKCLADKREELLQDCVAIARERTPTKWRTRFRRRPRQTIAAVLHRNKLWERHFQACDEQVMRINEMKAHFEEYKNCVSCEAVLATMSPELREWITSGPLPIP